MNTYIVYYKENDVGFVFADTVEEAFDNGVNLVINKYGYVDTDYFSVEEYVV